MANVFWGEIEEITSNICGVIDYGAVAYYITSMIDDAIDREFSIHTVFDLKAPDTEMYLYIARHDNVYNRKKSAVHMIIKILQQVKGRSCHFPKLLVEGKIKKLIYGENGDQQDERDPEWIGRPCCIVQYEGTMLYSLLSLSPTGSIPLEIALQVGLGCVRALASLHRLGYIHRQVSPFSFSCTDPITYDNLEAKMLITDLGLALPWPCKPRLHVPFVGTLRYSSVRVHRGREQGPSDDIISLIYMVAEMTSGKLPWRSVFDPHRVCEMKCEFYLSSEFKRLPREIRSLYRTMYLTLSPLPIDHKMIIDQFKTALKRRFPDEKRELPPWLQLPIEE